MTEYNNNSPVTTTSRVTKRTSRPYHLDYASSFDEAEESDSYTSRRSRRLSESNHRRIGSTYGLSYVSNRRMERMEVKEDESNGLPSRRRYTRKWETDDEQLKPNHRSSMPIMSQQQHSPQHSPVNIYPDEAVTTRSLLYNLGKERTKRREIQNAYDTTVQTLKELQQNHQDDLVALESDIQTLQDALVKEAKANIQLNKLLRESTSKFTEEMQNWANKVVLMEEQGKELQQTFQETMEQLEKEEEEIIRLRKENQSLRDQLAGRAIEPANLNRRNLEDVRKVGSMEDRDDVSVSAESKQECISDNESVANYSKLTELNDRIMELENELITSKENTQKVESSFQQLETDKDIKPISHKPSQQFSSPPSPKLQQHHQPLEQDEEEDLQPVNDDWRNHHRPGQMKRRSIISENFPTKERKNSLTSTNSGSIEGTSVTGGSLEDKGEGEAEQSEISSEEEEEEEEERDDQSSSVFTGSNGSEEVASVQDSNALGRQQHHQLHKDNEVVAEEDDDILDAILSDREDRSLPLIGHYSAAEYTEDEDFDFDLDLDYGRPSYVGRIGGNKIEVNSMVMALNQIASGGRRGRSVDDGIP